MPKVFVAMSGGVDSSVAAALMKKAAKPKDFEKIFGRAIPKGFSGFDVVGVFMKPWQSQSPIVSRQSLTDCLWKQDREDALRVAAKLEIPLLTWDFSKEYGKYVAEYMIDGYRRGLTPNPDVRCNKFIKFGLFLDKALKMGADYIATGHYAQKRKVKSKKEKVKTYTLLKAKDPNKDQSYFLYTLTQKQLKHCLFPIGDWTKDEVRQMAKKFGLPNWAKPDSQGICFVGPLEFGKFLKRYIEPKTGLVVRKSDGKVLGNHDGVWYYTIGQRHGLNLSAGVPYYIVAKDVKNNTLYVDAGLENPKSEILNPKQIQNSKLQIKDFNWINQKEKLPLDCRVKTRYRQHDLNCTITKNGADLVEVNLKENNIPVAPGQSAVFYKGIELLGGGIIS